MNNQFGELRSALERRAWSEVDAILADWTPERRKDARLYLTAKGYKTPLKRAIDQTNQSVQALQAGFGRDLIPAMRAAAKAAGEVVESSRKQESAFLEAAAVIALARARTRG